MGWKQFAADYFSFTRRDRIAILVLVLLVILVWLAPRFAAMKRQPGAAVPDTAWVAALRELEAAKPTDSGQARENRGNEYLYDPSRTGVPRRQGGVLFYFDPNTLPGEGWERLGLRTKTIRTIRNFISKGGRFREPADLRKVYSLFPDEYERIAPYVRIEVKEKRFAPAYPAPQDAKTTARRYAIVDINTADTSALIALPGIGSKLANRIVTFRDKLGGFYTVDQVGETFGLADSTFQKIKQYLVLGNAEVKKININTATVDELKSHPYIKYSLANPIVAYRKEHGLFKKLEDIKNIMAIPKEAYTRIFPYLTL